MIEIKDLCKVYSSDTKEVVALNNINLEINDGEIFGFIGPNGAGKTTTIKCIMGLIPYDNGKILFNNIDNKKNPIEFKKNVIYIPDNPDLYDSLTGIQFLNFIADIYEISKEQRQMDINKYSELFDLKKSLGDLISSYSHGMKQKLCLISAFLRHPKLLILDEPFVGLDPEASKHVKELMKELCNEGGSVFFSTHVLEVAEKLCDHIAIIKNGQLVACGTMEEVKGDQSLEDVFFDIAAKKEDLNE